jgi:cytochrome c biogenesis protein CcmG, thiol:disulfide interchange protein DsbE
MAEPTVANSIPTSSGTRRSKVMVMFAAGLILAVMFLVVWLQSAKYEPLTVGKAAPDFQLPDLDDKEIRLSDYRGKVVFLNFWATWCKPCREEMPSMEVLYKNFEKDGLVILAVSIDRVTTKKEIPPFVKSLNLTFPVLVDSWGQTDKRYKLMGVPETYIIDREGTLREKVIGPRDWTRLDNLQVLTQLIKQGYKSAGAAADTTDQSS